jgi:GNAT superfamily N-acetyltransferase
MTDEAGSSYIITTYAGPLLPLAYRNMIFSKWLKSLRHGNEQLKLIDAKSYYAYHHLLIDDLLARPTTQVRIASAEDDKDVALGFSVARPGAIVDYVYVNRDLRRNGIGKALVPYDVATYTHLTKTALLILKKKPIWGYNPYI